MLLIAYYQIRYNWAEGWFNLALYEFAIMNVLFFLVWLRNYNSTPFPWWIIPFFILLIPVSIAHLKYHRNEHRYWVYACVALVLLSLMTFFIWGFVVSYWPWFLIEWGIAGGLIFALWYYKRSKDDGTYEMVSDETVFMPGSNLHYSNYDSGLRQQVY